MHWKFTALLVCIYGVVKEFRPGTPFLTPFLESEFKNFTNEIIYSEIYPFWTYSYLLFLIPVFFLTDALRYKPVVILEALSLCATWALMIWGKSVRQMQLMQICFGLASSAEIAYYSYMYAVVDRKHYKKITSYTRAAKMVGKFFAYSLAQIFITTGFGSYLLLIQITFGAVFVVFFISLFLPPIAKPRLQGEIVEIQELKKNNISQISETNHSSSFFKDIKQKLSIFKENETVLIWSIWWALASCGTFQISNYVQTLWARLQNDGQFVGNGMVECVNTLLGAIITFYLQYIKFEWKKYGEFIFFTSSLAISISLLGMSEINNIFILYGLYLFTDCIYHMLIAAASNIIASQLNSASYSFIFGFNTFIALIFQTILTFLVTDKHGFALKIQDQFRIYSGYFLIMALLFCIPFGLKVIKKRNMGTVIVE
uniref:Uncharacterized protein n=1 Tax=Panagrolaimus superbus TaxID=310955 RepID=A0A914YRE9_9BILA